MTYLRGKCIFVTGAAGFIGANLVRELLERGAAVHALVRPTTNLWRLAGLDSGIVFHRADLAQGEELKSIVREVRPAIIYHFGMSGGCLESEKERRESLLTSVIGTSNLLETVGPIDYEGFIYCGSSLEYGFRNRPLKETDRLEPGTFRGAAKAATTLLCRQFARAHSVPLVILRPFSVYGYWEQPSHLIPTAIKAFLCGGEIALTSECCRHDYVFVEDVIEACLIATQGQHAAGESFNIGTGEQWTNEEVIAVLRDVVGHDIQVKKGSFPARPADTAHWVADITKAGRLLGWKSKHSLRRGLEKTVDWFRGNLGAYTNGQAR